MKEPKIVALYIRVSSKPQNTQSQVKDLQRWVETQGKELGRVKWYEDKTSGLTMNRPQWNKLQAAIDAGKVSHLVCWRLDRLGRTALGLCRLFEELQTRKVRLVSLKDNIDLGTPAGRLIAHVIASVAAYETEIRGERVRAGQAVARAAGKRWGGSKKGVLHKLTAEQVRQIYGMKQAGERIVTIGRTVGANRQTIYRVLSRVREGCIKV